MFHVNPAIATPRQIDWLVAQIEGYTGHLKASGSIIYTKDDGSWVDDVNWAVTSRPFYSMPIIEREKIAIIPATYGPDSIIHGSWRGIIGYNSDNGEHLYECDAETPLFAAMRVYVASKLGWFPEVPNALV